MTDIDESLRELQDNLDRLSPSDFAAWSDWVEERLTGRLRLRQTHPAPLATPIPTDKESPRA